MLPEFESPRIYGQALQDRASSFSSVEYSLKSRCGVRGLAFSVGAFVSFCRPEQVTNIASLMETMRQATADVQAVPWPAVTMRRGPSHTPEAGASPNGQSVQYAVCPL